MRSALLAVPFLLALACSEPPPPAADGGIVVEIPDALPDAPPEDGGDGTCGTSIALSGWGALPDTCLPRCTRATGDTVRACTTTECLQAAWAADETPSVLVQTYAGPLGVSCSGIGVAYPCVGWQIYSCLADECTEEYRAWAKCRAGGAACDAEQTTLDACADADPEFGPCVRERGDLCYATE